MTPPRLARHLARLLTPRDLRDELVDDLDEAFRMHAVAHGTRRARRWYRRQVLTGLAPTLRLHRARLSDRRPTRRRHRLTPALRHGVRRLVAAPAFAASACVTLTLAFAAMLTIVALVDGILLTPLPYDAADRIVDVGHRTPGLGVDHAGQSQGAWFLYREAARSFETIGIYNTNHVNLTGDTEAERAPISMVSHEVFDALGVSPLLGTFGPADDGPAAPPAVILSWGLWQRRYGGDPDIVGRTIGVNGRERQVLAVMPRGFSFPTDDTALWMRQGFDPAEARFGELAYGSVARLRPGVTPADAEAELDALIERLPDRYADARPEWLRESGLSARVEPLRDIVVAGAGAPLLLMLASAGLMMLLAWANVVNLFVIRAEQRQRDTGICRALGATNRHLFVSLLAESLLVCGAAAATAIGLAGPALDWLGGRAAGLLPRLDAVALGPRAFGALAFLAVATAITLAAAGLWRSRRASLQAGPRGASAARPQLRLRLGLVAGQVALAFILVCVSTFLVGSVRNLVGLDKGFDPDGVLTFEIALPRTGYETFARAAAYHAELTRRLLAVPGVRQAGAVTDLPLSGFTLKQYLDSLVFVDAAAGADAEAHGVNWKLATPGYFETMRIPILAGRWATPGEHHDATNPVVVSERFARRHLGDAPLGRQIRHYATPRWSTVVGVVGDVTDDGLRPVPAEAVYVPVLDQEEAAPFVPSTMTHVLRATGPAPAVVAAVRAAAADLDPDVPVARAETMTAIVSRAMARDTLVLTLVATAGGLAVLVGLVGLGGALAYSITERRRELGVRMALGASPGQLRWAVVRLPLIALTAGLAAGVPGAAALGAVFGSLLFEVEALDATSYLASASTLVATAAIALALPARRLRRISPVEALRAE